ncbi:MAG: DEAD/DEAH box helicase [Desulfobacterales bacterium]|nr:DEAD/DEAH box helicase [Desulfobacterales bacterium]
MYKSDAPPTPGVRILCRDAEWLVTRVDAFDYADEYAIHCVGVDDLVRGHQSVFLTQLDRVEPVDPTRTKLVKDESSGYRMSKLFLEAQLRRMPATGLEPDLEGMGVFNPMRFQEATARRALRQLRPRLLLADAVGLGKTIEVGMILTELIRRGRADRILTLAKKSMLTQFQAELWNRFNIPLVRLDSAGIARVRLRIPGNKNPFEVFQRVIISMDTLKNVGRYEHFLKETRWDVVIIDEAHNVAGASVPERHLSNRLARLLSRRADSVLLTTATPHNGKRETFGRLISLLDPSAIPDPKFREYDADDIKDFFFMRFKEDVREEASAMLAEREVAPVADTTANASEAEEKVYKALADLRRAAAPGSAGQNGGQSAGGSEGQPGAGPDRGALFRYGLYKLFLSSPEACRRTVNNRLEKLDDDHSDPVERSRLEKVSRLLEGLSLEGSTRYRILKEELEKIGWNGGKKSPRILLFTEYRRTQEALAHALAKDFKLEYSDKFEDQAGRPIAVLHGSTPDVHLMKTVEAFGAGASPQRILIATDVASEGVNLHHECHHIIHYDLPWSIITLIQRNGRIDRLGQEKNPVLRYLMVNSELGLLKGDQAVFNRLIDKVEEINRMRQSGESVLRLYDPKAEEAYIAHHGVLAGDAGVFEKAAAKKAGPGASDAAFLESLLKEAGSPDQDDLMNFFMGEEEAPGPDPASPPGESEEAGRLRLYSDRDFLVTGYHFLRERNPDYLPLEETEKLVILTAPEDLKRRLGKSGDGAVFGAAAIPMEAWPENDQFRLTDDPGQADLAIKAARRQTGCWSRELLCTELHPILKWLDERLLMTVDRGEAPIVLSPDLDPGELCFCFIGQVSSLSGLPLIVDGHAISFYKGENEPRPRRRTLKRVLEKARFDALTNTGREPNILAARPLIHAGVRESLQYMHALKEERGKRLMSPLRKEERRLWKWKSRREDILLKRIAKHGEGSAKSKRLKKRIEEIEAYATDRRKVWLHTHVQAAERSSTRLVLVIEGRGMEG